jgi:hypothetical membrane protein
MPPTTAGLHNPRIPRYVSLVILLYFAAEWVVAATWRGLYSYRADGFGLLGLPFCGPGGDWPCSALYPAFNAGCVLSGLAVVIVVLSWQFTRLIAAPHALLLIGSGLGLALSGVITQRVDYDWHVTAVNVFLALGAVGVFLVGTSASTGLAVGAKRYAVVAGVAAMVGYFGYLGSLTTLLGAGGTQRLAVYAILSAIIVLAVTIRPRPGAAEPSDSDEQLQVSA